MHCAYLGNLLGNPDLRPPRPPTPTQLDRPSPFVNALLPGDPANKEPLAHLADTPLPPAVERLYGAWLVAHLALLRAQFLLAAGGVPSQWRQTDWKTGERVAAPAPATPAKGAAKKETAAAVVTEAVGSGLPEAVEPVLLEKANALLRRALVGASRLVPPLLLPLLLGKGG